jgi:hypothetical protein
LPAITKVAVIELPEVELTPVIVTPVPLILETARYRNRRECGHHQNSKVCWIARPASGRDV